MFWKKKPTKFKRIIKVFDFFDEIPANAKYLYTQEEVVAVASENDEESRVRRIVHGEDAPVEQRVVCIHYYEVSQEDFDFMAQQGFFSMSMAEKVQLFMDKYDQTN